MVINIGCISDTHVPTRASRIPEKVYEIFNEESVKIIFFAGDLVTLKIIDALESNTNAEEILIVSGNMDKYEVKKKYPKTIEYEILGYTIKMAHKLHDIQIKGDKVHLAIYGHTHKNKIHEKGRTILINPGSGTGSGFLSDRSVGIVQITEKKIIPSIKKF
ncbi:MAG: metallophosphoesterase family protein [Candidatus Helarchaeota archaeon]